jgi:hypothetical protein
MADATIRVPETQSSDPTEVAEALEIARTLWEKGERRDAIRWVRRAAEAADEAGETTRVATLARAAAELEEIAASLPTSQTRPASRPMAPSATPPPLPSKRPPKSPLPPPVAAETRLRVSVRTSARDPGLLIVRELPEGQAPPAGAREAFLVMAEPAAKGNVA